MFDLSNHTTEAYLYMGTLWVIGLSMGFLYLRNLYFAINGLRKGQISIKMVLRYIGVFMVLIGIFMGMVGQTKEGAKNV